jgi:hypothetical protein
MTVESDVTQSAVCAMGGSTKKRPWPAAGPLRPLCAPTVGPTGRRFIPFAPGHASVTRLFLGLCVLWCCFGCVAATGEAEQLTTRNPTRAAAAVAAVTTIVLGIAQCGTPAGHSFTDCPLTGALSWLRVNSSAFSGEHDPTMPSVSLDLRLVVEKRVQGSTSGRKRKRGFRGRAKWKSLQSADGVTPASDQGADLANNSPPAAPAIGRESLRNVEHRNYAEPQAQGMPYSMLTGTCSNQLRSDTTRVVDIIEETSVRFRSGFWLSSKSL